jgi:hypothetical protein
MDVPLLRTGSDDAGWQIGTACPAEAVPCDNSTSDFGRSSSGTALRPLNDTNFRDANMATDAYNSLSFVIACRLDRKADA